MSANGNDVAVIGAGAVGCSIAYHLAQRGAKVTVIEASGVGAATSSATLGLVWVQTKQPAGYMELNLASARLHARLAPKYSENVGLRQPGGLIICLDVAEFERLVGVTNRLNTQSPIYRAKVLTAQGVGELEPEVSPEIAGGIYGPHDGHINPIKLVINLARLASHYGAQFMLHTRATQIVSSAEGVRGVDTTQGFIPAHAVVVAAGFGMPNLVKPLGLNIPLDFIRGEILVTAPLEPRLKHPSRHVLQTVDGNLLLGSTHDRAGLDNSTTVKAAGHVSLNAIRSFPFLKHVPVIRQYAGIRPMPVDGKPYLGQVERVPGLYIAVSHSGITLSAIFGKIISDLIIEGDSDIPLDLYKPERYHHGKPEDLPFENI